MCGMYWKNNSSQCMPRVNVQTCNKSFWIWQYILKPDSTLKRRVNLILETCNKSSWTYQYILKLHCVLRGRVNLLIEMCNKSPRCHQNKLRSPPWKRYESTVRHATKCPRLMPAQTKEIIPTTENASQCSDLQQTHLWCYRCFLNPGDPQHVPTI